MARVPTTTSVAGTATRGLAKSVRMLASKEVKESGKIAAMSTRPTPSDASAPSQLPPDLPFRLCDVRMNPSVLIAEYDMP